MERIREIPKAFDSRRDLVVPGDSEQTLRFSVEHFIETAQKSIDDHDFFSVALSGGSTPKAIYEGLAGEKYRDAVDWSHVYLFWSDERCVPPDSPESNYRMAIKAGFGLLPIPEENIFRMQGEDDPEKAALDYERDLAETMCKRPFDLVMLGMGDDGHTASLFPKTHGLHADQRNVIANYIPQKETWRLSLTFKCINSASHICIYVIGYAKKEMVKQVLNDKFNPDLLPAQNIGTAQNKALWILDDQAASLLI